MISKNHFLNQIKKLNSIYPDSALNDRQAAVYYEMMACDFTDHQFDEAIKSAVKSSFKFPPIAAFYRKPAEESYHQTDADLIAKGLDPYL